MMTSPRLCVIVFQGRSGSSWLTSMLDQHPRVAFEGEILHELMSSGYKGSPEGWASQKRWIEDFMAGEVKTCLSPKADEMMKEVRVVGFKTKLDSIGDLSEFSRLLEEKNAVVIRLCRSNRLEQILSHLRALKLAERSGVWNVGVDSSYVADPLDVGSDIDAFFSANELYSYQETKIDGFVGRLSLPKYMLSYEQLLRDTENTMRHIYDVIGVDYINNTGLYKKMSPEDIACSVKDLGALKKMCSGTLLEQYL